MKKLTAFLAIICCLFLSACSGSESVSEIPVHDIQPQETQMKSICELATLKCYYHNVAKYYEKDAEGALLWKKDRKFWVEYSGIVTIGVDTSKVRIKVDDTNVTVTLPPATVMGCKVDETSLSEDSFIIAADSAKVEAEHQTAAYKEAQANMEKSAASDSALLENARQEAQKLLENYINNIGDCVGKKYNIEWVYLEAEQQVQETFVEDITE